MDWRTAWERERADLDRRTGGISKDIAAAYAEVFRKGYQAGYEQGHAEGGRLHTPGKDPWQE